MDDEMQQPPQRERVGQRAWVRTVGLVGGGLVAGGILAGTLTANAATDEPTTPVPVVLAGRDDDTGQRHDDRAARTAAAAWPARTARTDATGSTDEGTTDGGHHRDAVHRGLERRRRGLIRSRGPSLNPAGRATPSGGAQQRDQEVGVRA